MNAIPTKLKRVAPLRRTVRLGRTPVGLSLGASAAIQALSVVTGVLLARALGPYHRGELAAVLLWPTLLAAIGSLGVTQAVTYMTARNTWSRGAVVGSAMVLALAQSVVLVAVGVPIIPMILHRYSGDARLLALVFLAYVPLNLVCLFMQAVLNGLHDYRGFQLTRVLVVLASAVPLVVLAVTHRLFTSSAMGAYLGANALTTAVVLVLVWRATRGSRLECSRPVLREMIVFGLKSHTSTVSSTFNQRLDQLLISAFLAPVRLGLYVVAVTLSSLGALIGISVSMVVLPAVSALHDPEAQVAAIRKYVALTFALCVVVTLPLLLATSQFIDLFFGHAFEPVTNVCRVLLVASIALGVNRALNAALTGLGRPLDAGIAETVALVFTVGGLAALLPTMGLMGAALASLVAYGVSTSFMANRAGRALGISGWSLFAPRRLAVTDSPAVIAAIDGTARR